MAPQLKQMEGMPDVYVPPYSPTSVHDIVLEQQTLPKEQYHCLEKHLQSQPQSQTQTQKSKHHEQYHRTINLGLGLPMLETIDECEHDVEDGEILFVPQSPRLEKSVKFAPVSRYRTIETVDDYSDEEIDATWYSPEELNGIKHECIYTIQLMVKNVPFDEDVYSIRGLEYKTNVGAKIRRRNKLVATTTVLDEQAVQRSEGVYDPQYLAEVYQCMTQGPRHTALTMAMRDQEAATRVATTKSSLVMYKRNGRISRIDAFHRSVQVV